MPSAMLLPNVLWALIDEYAQYTAREYLEHLHRQAPRAYGTKLIETSTLTRTGGSVDIRLELDAQGYFCLYLEPEGGTGLAFHHHTGITIDTLWVKLGARYFSTVMAKHGCSFRPGSVPEDILMRILGIGHGSLASIYAAVTS